MNWQLHCIQQLIAKAQLIKQSFHDASTFSSEDILCQSKFTSYVVQAAEIQHEYLIKSLAAKVANQAWKSGTTNEYNTYPLHAVKAEPNNLCEEYSICENSVNIQKCTTCNGIIVDAPTSPSFPMETRGIKWEVPDEITLQSTYQIPDCHVCLKEIHWEQYRHLLRQPVVLVRKLCCNDIQEHLHPCVVKLKYLSTAQVQKNLSQPTVCLGLPLSILLRADLESMNKSELNIIKPKFNQRTKDLIRPPTQLSTQMQDLLTQTLSHPEKAKNFPCKECAKTYSSAKTLYGHVKLVHKGEFKYQCEACGCRFLNKHHYRMHRPLHLNILNFECKECDRRFVRKPLLEHHIKNEHACLFDCAHCDKSYSSRKAMQNHLRNLNSKYQCPICHKNFSSFHTCRRHCKTCQ